VEARLTLFLALLLLCTGAALAQTPDACDGETGAAYGLCNAYCEAMDCDSDNAQASETACAKVKDKFANITGRTSLPCEAPPVTCPCNDPAVNQPFADTVAGQREILSCLIGAQDGSTLSLILSPTGDASVANGRCSAFGGQTQPLTPEQYQLCFQLLQQAAANQGVTCQ
jgi:hypothetical protein